MFITDIKTRQNIGASLVRSNDSLLNNIATGLFRTNDVAEANLLRRAILSEIDTYTIDIVVFQINTSPRHDEIIALLLGQLVIDHSKFDDRLVDEHIAIDVSGPLKFTSDHIIGLPFTFTTPICELLPGQRIKCDVIVQSGQGKIHCKWRPVSLISITDLKEGYFVTTVDISKEFKVNAYETHYIDSVIINSNTTTMNNEYIAQSIGQLQIDYDKFIEPDADTTTITIRQGPGTFIAENIPGIVFKYHKPVGQVLENQEIVCDIVIKKGKRTEYIKWKSNDDDFGEDDSGYFFRFKNIGMMTTERIFEAGYAKIREAADRPAITLFSQVLVPANMNPNK